MAQLDNDVAELVDCWRRSPHPTVKVMSYFPVYIELFQHLRNTKCTFIETGVLDGGSLFMWRDWLGPDARIIGIDLNPEAKRWSEHGFEIHIGDQGDPAFWRSVFNAVGPFDALLDDGGHQSFQQIVTVVEAMAAAPGRCVVAVEDTSTSMMKDFAAHGPHSFLSYAKAATDALTARFTATSRERILPIQNAAAVQQFQRCFSVSFYAGIVAFRLVEGAVDLTPTIERNRPPNSATDFRYKGKASAQVLWPDPFAGERVTVQGGEQPSFSVGTRVKRLVKCVLPAEVVETVRALRR